MTAPLTPAPALTYPATRRDVVVDDYHGTPVADPFRWLEDDTSAETAAWVDAQNRVTFGYLGGIPYRDQLRARLTQLVNYPRVSAPEVKRQWQLFARNDGLQNQAVYYLQEGRHGIPEVLIDPNTLSADGTTRVGTLTFDREGAHLAYMISQAGSDWQQIRVLDLATRDALPDVVDWVKVSGLAWHGRGFFYSRYPEPVEAAAAYSSMNEDHQVFYHALGTPQSEDRLVYRDAQHPQRFHVVGTTEDERYAVLSVSDRGQGKDGNALFVMDLAQPGGSFVPLWDTFDDQMDVIDSVDGGLLVLTNRHAPNQRVVRIDPAAPDEAHWVTVIPERAEPVSGMTAAGGRIFASYLKDVTTRAVVHHLDGALEREVTLPGLGTAMGFGGEHDATSVFYTFTSFTAPATVYEYDIASGVSTQYRDVTLPFDPGQFETTQIFVPSKDGTRVPAFVVARRGLVLDGTNPTMLYGYGGFNVSLPPAFSAMRVAFLEQGGVYVQANLRGGNEYGEAWHQAGMKERKQNVFDDFTAVAEWLIGAGYTCSDKLAIAGGSNGGLLVGAIMTQRPTLARVALPAVGVMDMLRFHKFTIGWNWIADYGSSDDAEGFRYLHAYSPLHNLRDGTTYPATLITTADHDDRVVPAHSFKFAARLQDAHRGPHPVLIRIETQSGHGSSSLSKQIDEMADVYAFLFENLGVVPVFS
ncbi:MAG: prolyl oligopeptidase family serine peptidase [Gemmatimonadota bacterium]|nr:prolyl oligopeptidase family serine peptidase [Gemmatimonadota bacterium]MDQ8173029.1 prolyl oligopeptidase family serine peptidase [Gemmatimonadota bacterium]